MEETLEAAETAASISRFLRAQSELDRRLFVRRYWHLERVEALAKGYGLGLSQTKSRLSRTRKRLKAHLEKEGIFV